MRLYSWNVNGLRSCAKKGFLDWLNGSESDLVGLQETRVQLPQLPEPVAAPMGWHLELCPAKRPGYSGVGLYSRNRIPDVESSLGVDEYDAEGRLQIAQMGSLTVANVYFPNGSGKNRDNSRVPFKLGFYRALFDRLEPTRKQGAPILVMGDFNTAHRAIDLARPQSNHKTSGFLPEEREELDRWLRDGWTDTFRLFCEEGGHYTWWSNRFGVRERNIGWRIDYILASPGALPYLKAAQTHPNVMGSDHCPISVDLDPAILDWSAGG
jgi:exodeoxyribonuclease-3